MLYLVATPIGNLEDITLRALRVLKEVDFILAEDTRTSGLLLKHYGIAKPLSSFHDHNEAHKTAWVVSQIQAGKTAALISDSGMPAISDPGYTLVRACRQQGIRVSVIPGASSIVTALAATAIPHDKFFFMGYLPRKKNACKKILEHAKCMPCALAALESPFRVLATLEAIREVFGDCCVAACRELTKKFEEIIEMPVSEVIAHFQIHPPRGEFVIIIDNKNSGHGES